MNKHNEIQDAIQFLRDNGYIVVKKTDTMIEDSSKCEEMSRLGKDMECSMCSCNMCLVGYCY